MKHVVIGPKVDRMKRRAIVLCMAALATGTARGQASRHWRIGVLRPGPKDAVFQQNFDPFVSALSGLMATRNISMEYRVRPAGSEEMLAMAKELVQAKVDAIVAIATGGVTAAAKATRDLPIVAIDLETDPVGQKFAASLARPGGNITGVFLDFPELSGKWIQLLKEAMPALERVAVLSDAASGPYLLRGAQAAGAAMRMQMQQLEARGPAEFATAFEAAANQKSQALLVLSSPVFNSARKSIADLALKHQLPTVMPFPQFADDGGLMAYGPHLTDLFRQAAGIMAKILKGESPASIAIERPVRFEFVINLRTARALGLKIPHSLMVRADRVIE